MIYLAAGHVVDLLALASVAPTCRVDVSALLNALVARPRSVPTQRDATARLPATLDRIPLWNPGRGR